MCVRARVMRWRFHFVNEHNLNAMSLNAYLLKRSKLTNTFVANKRTNDIK